MESVVSLASDSACLYEQLGYMFLSDFFVRTLLIIFNTYIALFL